MWPPYKLMDRHYLEDAQRKHSRLERLYHVGAEKTWDGRKILGDLLKKHGSPRDRVPVEKRQALAEIFSTILWGELAAWSISADLALQLESVEAKMAATGQVFDEARHFYVMRDYLLELDIDLPPLDGYTHTVLTELLDSKRLIDKLLGMQLIVESVAVTLFRTIADAGVEPVLTELMPYFERDEARHVGLGVLYLPELLSKLSFAEGMRLRGMQMKIATLIGWGSTLKRKSFETLGIDNHESFKRGMRLNQELLAGMRQKDGKVPRGVVVGSEAMDKFNNLAIDLFFPPLGAELPGWHSRLLGMTDRLSRLGDRALRALSS